MRCALSPRLDSSARGLVCHRYGVTCPLARRLPQRAMRASDKEGTQTSTSSVDDEVLPVEEIQRLAGVRRQQQQAELAKDANVIQ
ncbi:hypothetical protein TSOC_014838, partial [Tetrabaena socialis]